MLCWPRTYKFINLIPNHHTKITKFNAYERLRVDHVTRCIRTWKRRPLLAMQGRWRDRISCQVPKAVCPTILIEWLEDSWLSSMGFPPTQRSGGSSHLMHSWHGPQTRTRRHICLPWVTQKGCSGAHTIGWAPICEHSSHTGSWKQKSDTETDTNIWKLVGGSTLKKKISPKEGPGHN